MRAGCWSSIRSCRAPLRPGSKSRAGSSTAMRLRARGTPSTGPKDAPSATGKKRLRWRESKALRPPERNLNARKNTAGKMSILVRRSNLLVSLTHEGRLREAWRCDADAVTLDLDDTVPLGLKAQARE